MTSTTQSRCVCKLISNSCDRRLLYQPCTARIDDAQNEDEELALREIETGTTSRYRSDGRRLLECNLRHFERRAIWRVDFFGARVDGIDKTRGTGPPF
jgi:hypothetical protein